MSSNCQDCYQVQTPNPCDKIGCIETNYTKCIKYSGDPLYCGRGPIGTITVSGLAAVFTGPPAVSYTEIYYPALSGTGISGQETRGGVLTYTVTGTASGLSGPDRSYGPFYPTSVNGAGAAFTVDVASGAINNSTGVDLVLPGSEYNVGDNLTLDGTLFPAGTGSDDLTITVNTVSKFAKFRIKRTAGSNQYTVQVIDAANNYIIGEQILIKGSQLGGVDGTNDLTITVASIKEQINTLDNLDVVIKNINTRLCSLFGSFSDYSAFNFSCLRVGGGLGSGTSIQNEQQFVEAASAAICSVNARVLATETPTMSVPACLSLTSGTSTLSQILTELASKVCSSYNQSAVITGITTPVACTSDFSAQPGAGTATATQWINWILTNICSIKSVLAADVAAHEGRLDNIDLLIGTTYTKFDNSAVPFSSGAHGGAINQDMRVTIGVLKNVLITFNGYFTAMGANLRANSFAVANWAACFTGVGASTSAVTLETQLGWIVDALKQVNFTFNGSHFVVTGSACGASVSLNPAVIFSCSMLSSCSLNNLGDVNITSPSDRAVLLYNGADWVDSNIDDVVKITSADASIGVTKTVAPGEVTYDLSNLSGVATAYQLTPNILTGVNLNNLPSAEYVIPGSTYVRVIKQSNLCVFEGTAFLVATLGGYTSISNSDITLSTGIPTAVRPQKIQYFGCQVIRKSTPLSIPTHVYGGVITVTPAGEVKLRIIEPAGVSTNIPSGEELEVMIGGISYHII